MMEKRWQSLSRVILALGLISSVLLAGCVEIGGTDDSGQSEGQNFFSGLFSSGPEPTLPSDYYENPPVPISTPLPTAITTRSPGSAAYSDPVPPDIAFKRDFRNLTTPAADISQPLNYSTAPFFTETFSPCYTTTAILATDVSPPFVIEFRTDAESLDPYDSLVVITVRDPATGKVIAENGYNGMYSSEETKRIIIRSGGTYHVNLYGFRATVQLALRGGVPDDQAVPYGVFGVSAQSSTPEDDYDEEYYEEGRF